MVHKEKSAWHRAAFSIAVAEDPESPRPCFLFAGAPAWLVRYTFGRLTGGRAMMAAAAEINTVRNVRHGKPRIEVTAELISPDTRNYSADLMRQLITIVMENTVSCKITWMPIEKFLNLN